MLDPGNHVHNSQLDATDGLALAPLPKRKAFLAPHTDGRRLHRELLQAELMTETGEVDWSGIVNIALRAYPPTLMEKIIQSAHAEFFLERVASRGADDKWARAIALPLADRSETLYVARKTLKSQPLSVIRKLVRAKSGWTPGKVLARGYGLSGPSVATVVGRLVKQGFRIRSARGARADGLKLPAGETGYRLLTQE